MTLKGRLEIRPKTYRTNRKSSTKYRRKLAKVSKKISLENCYNHWERNIFGENPRHIAFCFAWQDKPLVRLPKNRRSTKIYDFRENRHSTKWILAIFSRKAVEFPRRIEVLQWTRQRSSSWWRWVERERHPLVDALWSDESDEAFRYEIVIIETPMLDIAINHRFVEI